MSKFSLNIYTFIIKLFRMIEKKYRNSLNEKLNNKIAKYTITFFALGKLPYTIELSSSQSLDEFMAEFLLCFSKDISNDNGKAIINPQQQNTSELQKNIKDFVEKHKNLDPRINQLNTYFKKLEDGKYFFLLINNICDEKMQMQLTKHLISIESGESIEVISERLDSLFKEFLSLYEVYDFDKNTKKRIGESDKTKRVCRFCGKKSPEVKFTNEAHAISEALGNKSIILNEECDSCNNKFGSQMEIDLIKYLRFHCTFFGIKGKTKIPEIKSPAGTIANDGKNFGIINNEDGLKIQYYNTLENETIGDEFPLTMELRTGEDIVDQNLYKTLCKYALSVIDSKHLPLFIETMYWLNGIKEVDKLPKIGMLVTNTLFDKHPKMSLYIRKDKSETLPFAVAQFNFASFTFVFIIPFCKADKKDFLDNTDYKFYWDKFKHFSNLTGWKFFYLSGNKKHKLKMKIKIDQRKPEI